MLGSNPDAWLSEIELDTVLAMMQANGVTEILYKILPQNANSKNQVYLGGKDPSQFAKLPTGEMTPHVSVSQKKGTQEAVLRADLDFYWLTSEAHLAHAPHAKMIFYPQYPEVRFSGFLRGCRQAPSVLWSKEQRGTEAGRILLLGVGNDRKIIGLTLPPEAPATKEILAEQHQHATYEVFGVLPLALQPQGDGLDELLHRLCMIAGMGFVKSHRLNPDGLIVDCQAPNCNGNTLEALLGIRSNGFSKPDFMGWEVKARQVANSTRHLASVVTLFTPEPTLGVYAKDGLIAYVKAYGYADKNDVADRRNFGGIYRVNAVAHEDTHLRMVMDGYDPITNTYDPMGSLLLLDPTDKVAAGWTFAKLMDHWKIKHAQAAYVPCQKLTDPYLQYRYGRKILLGKGARFKNFLRALYLGHVYYDPGIKIESVSTENPKWKKRSQFRVSSTNLGALYTNSCIMDACHPIREMLP